MGRSQSGGQYSQISSRQDAFGTAGKERFHRAAGRFGYGAGPGGMKKPAFHGSDSEGVHSRVICAGHRSMEGDESAALIEEYMEGGDVAVSYEDLGVSPDDVCVQQRQQSHGSAAASQAEYPPYIIVGEGCIHVAGPLPVGAGQMPCTHPAAGHDDRLQAEGFQ